MLIQHGRDPARLAPTVEQRLDVRQHLLLLLVWHQDSVSRVVRGRHRALAKGDLAEKVSHAVDMLDCVPSPLACSFALHLGKDQQDRNQRTPKRRIELNRLSNGHKLHAMSEVVFIELTEVLDRTGDAIELDNDKDVGLTRQRIPQSGAAALGA